MRVKRSPADQELLNVKRLQGMMPRQTAAPKFQGDFRAELARHLYEQRMAGRADVALTVQPVTRHLCEVSVPPWLATTWAVSLGAPQQVGAALPAIVETYPDDRQLSAARVRWGVSGFTSEAYVDFALGQCFLVHGANVSVDLVTEVYNGPAPGGTGNVVRFDAGICPAPGAGSPAMPVTRSVNYGNIASGNTRIHPIPPFATEVSVHRRYGASPSDGYIGEFYNYITTIGRQFLPFTNSSTRVNYGNPSWSTIPGDATGFGIFAQQDQTLVVAVYRLALS